jgi:hypothetical protein
MLELPVFFIPISFNPHSIEHVLFLRFENSISPPQIGHFFGHSSYLILARVGCKKLLLRSVFDTFLLTSSLFRFDEYDLLHSFEQNSLSVHFVQHL